MKYAVFSRALSGITLAAVALASLPAAASPYTSMVVFGDSLSDSGNNAIAIGAQSQTITGNTYIPTYPYAPGTTYSNGPVWASYAASALGVSAAPSLAGGTNYAFGGATTGPDPSSFPYSLLTQANQYLASTGGTAASSALYVVAGGGNDARAALSAIAANPASAPAVIAATAASFVANVLTIVNNLNSAGAQHIIVWDTPNLGLAPAVVAGRGRRSRDVAGGRYERGPCCSSNWHNRRIDLRHIRSGNVDCARSVRIWIYQRHGCLRCRGWRELQHICILGRHSPDDGRTSSDRRCIRR